MSWGVDRPDGPWRSEGSVSLVDIAARGYRRQVALRGEKFGEQRRAAGRDRSAPGGVLPHDEVPSRGIGHGRTGLGADEEATEIVPAAVRVVHAVDVPVEGPLCHRAQVQRGGAERPVPTPTEVTRRVPGQPDQGATERLFARGGDDFAVAPCPPASHRLVAGARRLVHDQRRERPLEVQNADAGRVPRDAARGVRGTVHGVEHGEQRLLASPGTETGLFAEHP